MKRFLAVLVLCALPFFAQCRDRGEKKGYDLKRHELSLSGAVYPGRYGLGTYSMYYPNGSATIEDIYDISSQYTKEKTTNSWAFSYTYNFNKVLAVQCGISYEGKSYETYSRSDDKRTSRIYDSFISPTVALRVSWLNRTLVRLYSSIEAGVSLDVQLADPFDKNFNYVNERFEVLPALQLTALGVSVGTKVFGFAEVGIGTRYLGGCLGVGYRF